VCGGIGLEIHYSCIFLMILEMGSLAAVGRGIHFAAYILKSILNLNLRIVIACFCFPLNYMPQ